MNIYLDSIGCRLNQSEIERYARQFRSAGHTLVASMHAADLMVLNTCAVTAAAASDSRQKIRQAQRAGVTEIVVTGCLSTLQPENIGRMPGVVRLVPNEIKDQLVAELLQIDLPAYERQPLEREPIPGDRHRTRANIKVQDGCDNKCTFCVTTLARGASRSRPAADIIQDIQAAVAGGAREVVLTGVHLGAWGYDFPQPTHLHTLIATILDQVDIPRLRLSSLEPWDLSASFFDLWRDPRLCRHLHLPLQSGSAATLRRMARKCTPRQYAALATAARERIPSLALTTDIIAGFPGETAAEFEQTLAFVERQEFAGAHVFPYSERPGTAAARMPGARPPAERRARAAELRAITDASATRYRQRHIGQELPVLWEGLENKGNHWQLSGWTDNYLRVTATAPQPIWNQITPTRLTAVQMAGMSGEILELPDTIPLA